MKNFPKKLIEIYKNSFIISRSSIVIVSSLFASVFSYLFQFLSARSLSVEEYSELVSLFSLSVIIGTIMLVFTNGTTKLVAEIKSIDYPFRLSRFFFSLMKLVLVTTFFVFIGMIFFQKQIGAYLNIQKDKLRYIFAVAVVFGNINTALGPVLQGLQRFKAFSFYNIFNAFTKFLVALIVLYFSLTVIETFWGLVISTVLSIALGAFLLKKNLKLDLKAFDKVDIETLVKYSIGSILLCGVFVYWLFPKLVIGILFGQKYLVAEPYLPLFGAFMFVYTLLYLFGTFFISISKFKQGSLMLVGAIIQILGIHFFHENLYQVITISIIATVISLFLFIPSLYKTIKN